jgi:hypothetical protein
VPLLLMVMERSLAHSEIVGGGSCLMTWTAGSTSISLTMAPSACTGSPRTGGEIFEQDQEEH